MLIFPKRNLPKLLEPKVDAHARALKHLPHLALREARVVHAVALRDLRLALREVDEEEHAAGAQPLRQPRDGKRRVVEVVEPHPHARDVEAEKLRAGEPCRRWVGREEQVPYVCDPRFEVGSLEACQQEDPTRDASLFRGMCGMLTSLTALALKASTMLSETSIPTVWPRREARDFKGQQLTQHAFGIWGRRRGPTLDNNPVPQA